MLTKSPWLILLALTLSQSRASAEYADRYELFGTLSNSEGQALGTSAMVILSAVAGPFSAEVLADQDGHFRFSDLDPGLYSLLAALPQGPEARKTVEVGRDFADARRRVVVQLQLKRAGAASHTVTAAELAVPSAAREEHANSRSHLIRSDMKGAIACLKRALALAPWFAAAWNDLGTIAYQSHEYEEAETCFRQALKQEPQSYSPLVNLGTVLLSQKKTDESLAVNRQAVTENPDDPMAQAQLGMSYLYARNDEMALIHLKKAKELDPANFSYPQLALAQIYTRRKEFGAAVQEYEDFLTRHPGSRLVSTVNERLEKIRAQLVRQGPERH